MTAPKSFLPQQDTGQLGGFIRGDDGMSFQVMQPKIDAFRAAVLRRSRRSRASAASSAAAAASTTRRRSSASSRSPSARSRRRWSSSASARDLPKRARRAPVLDVRRSGHPVRRRVRRRRRLSVHAARRRHAAAAQLGRARARRRSTELPELTGFEDELVSSQQVSLNVDRAEARQLGIEMNDGDADAQQRVRPAPGLDDLQRAEPVSGRDGGRAAIRPGPRSARPAVRRLRDRPAGAAVRVQPLRARTSANDRVSHNGPVRLRRRSPSSSSPA